MSETSSRKSISDSNDSSMSDDKSDNMEDKDGEKLSSLSVQLHELRGQTNNDLQEHEHVLQVLLIYANKAFESSNYSLSTSIMLRNLLNYSNETILVPNLIKTNYPEALLKWLSSIVR